MLHMHNVFSTDYAQKLAVGKSFTPGTDTVVPVHTMTALKDE